MQNDHLSEILAIRRFASGVDGMVPRTLAPLSVAGLPRCLKGVGSGVLRVQCHVAARDVSPSHLLQSHPARAAIPISLFADGDARLVRLHTPWRAA